jgi:glucose-6-phosphate 1-dehydrogenase
MPGNRIYYLAIPPSLYEPTIQMIGQAGFGLNTKKSDAWIRVVVEKTFGRDLRMARELNRRFFNIFKKIKYSESTITLPGKPFRVS